MVSGGGIAGIVAWAVLSTPFAAVLVFFVHRRKSWAIKPRSPWLVLWSCLLAYGVLTVQVFQHAYPNDIPCELPYFIYCTAIPAFFACYILRAHRVVSLYEFSRVKASLHIKYNAVAQTMAVKSPFSIRRYPVDAIQKIIDNRAQYTEVHYLKFLLLIWGCIAFCICILASSVWDHGMKTECRNWTNHFTCVFILLTFWVCTLAQLYLQYTLREVFEGYKMKLELLIVTVATGVAVIPFTGVVGGQKWWPEYSYVGWIFGIFFLVSIVASLGIPLYETLFLVQNEGPAKKLDDIKQETSLQDFLSGPSLHFFQEYLVREFAMENLMFYTEVQKFKQLTTMDDLVKNAQDIYNKFLAPQAAFHINCSREHDTEINARLYIPDIHMFDPVLDSLLRDMENGIFPRFVMSDLFKQWQESRQEIRPKVERIVVN